MALIPPLPTKSEYELVPEGAHVARLYQIIHCGTVPKTWQGQEKYVDQVRLNFELGNELREFKEDEDKKPMSISTGWVTYSMFKNSNLRKLVEGMIGKKLLDTEADKFDLEQLLGEDCLLNVVHSDGRDGNTYANIVNAMPVPKGMEVPPLFNKTKVYDVNTTSKEELETLPKFIIEKIAQSKEWEDRYNRMQTVQEVQKPPF